MAITSKSRNRLAAPFRRAMGEILSCINQTVGKKLLQFSHLICLLLFHCVFGYSQVLLSKTVPPEEVISNSSSKKTSGLQSEYG